MKKATRILLFVFLVIFYASTLTHSQSVCSATATVTYNSSTGNLEGDISVTNNSQHPISICVRSILKTNRPPNTDCDYPWDDYTNYLSLGVGLTYNDTRYVSCPPAPSSGSGAYASFTVEVSAREGVECESDTIYCQDTDQCHPY